jgi:hypothetical protein
VLVELGLATNDGTAVASEEKRDLGESPAFVALDARNQEMLGWLSREMPLAA